MSVSIKWDDSKPVIHCTFHGDWTIEEFQLAAQAVEQMMATAEHQTDTLIDMEDAAAPFCLPEISDETGPSLPNAGTLIFVGAETARSMFGTQLATLFRYPAR